MTAIARHALTARDVQDAVLDARARDLPIAVHATGHGTHAPLDRGVVIHTAQMREVLVDAQRRVARVGPGATWGQVVEAAAPFGLAPLSGTSPTVGVAGYTLGGGLGWLSRKHGFAADSLLRAEVVTADGRLVLASPDADAELHWALRGGGGNFGIATALEVRLHPVAEVYGGTALFSFDRAAQTLARLREQAADQPDELQVSVVLLAGAPGAAVQRPVLALRGLYAGPRADAVRALRPLWQAAGPPLVDGWRTMAFPEVVSIGGTAPRHFELLRDLDDAFVADAVEAVRSREPLADAVEVRHWGGAMARGGTDAGPVGHRDVPFSVTIDGPEASAAPLVRHATGGSFLNFLHDTSRTADAYTAANLARLRELKAVYDPDNAMGAIHTIAPAAPVRLRQAA